MSLILKKDIFDSHFKKEFDNLGINPDYLIFSLLKAISHLASISAFGFSTIIEAMVTKFKEWILYPFSASTLTSPWIQC